MSRVGAGMSGGDKILGYDRQDLRKATKFTEGDYTAINPRQFYRTLKRTLEEIQEGGDFKYQTAGSQETDLEIESEEVGAKTGTVNGRLMATSDWREVESGELEYKPYGPHGAVGIVTGFLFLLLGLSSTILGVLGVAMILGSGYLYFQSESGEFPIHRQDAIRILMTGEVSERTIETDSETRTDIFANMSVIYAGDTFVNVQPEVLDELNWTLRREITTQIKKWYNETIDNPEEEEDVSTGFVANLTSWANRSARSDITTVRNLQNALNEDFENRLEYTDTLLNQLPEDTRDELAEHQDSLLLELEDLAEDMDVYVEREGLEAS